MVEILAQYKTIMAPLADSYCILWIITETKTTTSPIPEGLNHDFTYFNPNPIK